MHRTLIVARMDRADAVDVAQTFADSDSTDLPHMVGVSRRTLFAFHGLYFHLVEAEQDIGSRLYSARTHPLYKDINTRLTKYMLPFDPDWKEPRDAMAIPFYSWSPEEGPVITEPTGPSMGSAK
ncbi:TcmI family type II polyketide cyclase [Actinomadura sp. 3N508]|uniref:TcmI family type II polyketide cyclase n=1 Tax=Actinomadura sp. 3N508 TaxID=3375153 RepID=UPI0037A7515F